MTIVQCLKCCKDFEIKPSRLGKAKFCSRECSDSYPRKKNVHHCSECGVHFPIKKSAVERRKVWGVFCSGKCSSAFRSRMILGDNNPNSKSRNYDHDGYRLYVPYGKGKVKLHRWNAIQALGIDSIPKDIHIHHKDCNILNNDPKNLQAMSLPDHRWVHKEFGSATLWALQHDKVTLESVTSWSSDPTRANYLLQQNVITQGEQLKAYREIGLEPVSIVEFFSAINKHDNMFEEVCND